MMGHIAGLAAIGYGLQLNTDVHSGFRLRYRIAYTIYIVTVL